MRKIEFVQWLDSRGYAIVQEVQANNKLGEYWLARMILDDKGSLYCYEEIKSSKFKFKLEAEYQKQLKINKNIIMDIRETLEGLTIKELESLKPSYYNLAIDAKIAELKAMEVKKPKDDGVTKTKRQSKKTTKTTSRSRDIQA